MTIDPIWTELVPLIFTLIDGRWSICWRDRRSTTSTMPGDSTSQVIEYYTSGYSKVHADCGYRPYIIGSCWVYQYPYLHCWRNMDTLANILIQYSIWYFFLIFQWTALNFKLKEHGYFKLIFRFYLISYLICQFTALNEHGYFGATIRHYCRLCEALNYNTKWASLHHGDIFITTASESFYVLSHEYVAIHVGHSGRKRCMKTWQSAGLASQAAAKDFSAIYWIAPFPAALATLENGKIGVQGSIMH